VNPDGYATAFGTLIILPLAEMAQVHSWASQQSPPMGDSADDPVDSARIGSFENGFFLRPNEKFGAAI
jgi:hypothetical protein